MTIGQKYDCIYCLTADSMEARVDVKSRPYLVCSQCGTRTFIHGAGMTGPTRLWGKLSLALRDGNTDAARELIRREVDGARVESAKVPAM